MARRSKKETLHSRVKILRSAARVFRQRGYAGSGLEEIMRSADLTVGTFYAHFSSKAQLFEEALVEAALSARRHMMGSTEPTATPEKRPKKAPEKLPGKIPEKIHDKVHDQVWLKKLFNHYLSSAHRDYLENSCPISILGTDVSRLSSKNKKRFETLVLQFFSHKPEGPLLAALCLSVGALTLARAVHSEEFSDQILQTARQSVDLLMKSAE